MTAHGSSYEDVLKEAQEKGYAEADPTNDVSGYDAARKIAILATLGFHSAVTFNDVHVEGIENITKEDIEHATEMGYVIKLLAIARQDEDGISSTSIRPSSAKVIRWPMSTALTMPSASAVTASATSCSMVKAPVPADSQCRRQ